jgi:hypothetical protein
MLQSQTNELLMQVLDLSEHESTSQLDLLQEEYNAKTSLQEENHREQKLITSLHTSE